MVAAVAPALVLAFCSVPLRVLIRSATAPPPLALFADADAPSFLPACQKKRVSTDELPGELKLGLKLGLQGKGDYNRIIIR